MNEGGEKIHQKEEAESPPSFSLWLPALHSESLAYRKWELFEQKPLEPILEQQPHGLDLLVEKFIEVNPSGSGPRRFKENPLKGMEPEKTLLEAGKMYFVLITPTLKHPYRLSKFIFHLFPKSTLHRVGIAATESIFYGTENEEQRNQLGLISEAYEDGRQAAMQILVLNPNGVEVEEFAPFVQALLEIKPDKQKEATVQTQDQFLIERGPEKREPTHLGQVSEFLPVRPRLAKDSQKSKSNVTKPMKADEGMYRLKAKVPYLLHTQETVSLSNHEIALTHAFLESEKPIQAFGDALIDAGYQGKLTYLIVPKEDIILRAGEPIGYLLRINVPPTEEPYHGKYQEKKKNLLEK